MYVKLQMLGVLRTSPDSMSMSSLRDYIDPNMMDLYPHDCVFKVSSHFHIFFFSSSLIKIDIYIPELSNHATL